MHRVQLPTRTKPLFNQRLTVIFLVSTLRRTGPTMQLLNIVRHLDRERFRAAVVTLSGEPADSMLASFEAVDARVRSAAMSRARALVHRQWRADIGRLAGAPLETHCVVHSQGVRADSISARWLGGLPRLATARNDPYDDYAMKFGRLAGHWMATKQLRAMRAMTVVVACSSMLAAKLRNHGLDPRVIRNGVDTAVFRPPTPTERANARTRLGIAPEAHAGVCIGSLAERKDPLAIVRSVRAIDDPNLAILFVGSGELEAACRREAGVDPRIRFVGQSDDVLPYLHAADFFVSSSRSEGLPNSVLEALACGLPLLLSDIAPHAEVLEIAPASGLLYRLGDDTALADGIRAAMDGAGTGLTHEQASALIGAGAMSRSYQDLYLALAEPQR